MTERVLHYFKEISKIPRPSHQEKAISDYLVSFAKEHGLEFYQDELNNVIIIKEAAAGCEDREPVMLQGHMDMVAEKEPDCPKDMEMEGLDLVFEGDFVSAKGTTLGADDGVAIAYALAILESSEIKHPRIEFVCTVSEEVGMDGATGIDLSVCKSKKLINLDSEDEGVFLAGCAGGSVVKATLSLQRISVVGQVIGIEISGLTGGHSGQEIDKYRANATLVLNRLLTKVSERKDVALASLRGGSKDNAIPREAFADILCDIADRAEIFEIIQNEANYIKSEFALTDPDMCIKIIERRKDTRMAVASSGVRKVVGFINSLPNGVIAMSADTPGMVETSLNLGVTALNSDELYLGFCVRSGIDSAHDALVRKMKSVIQMLGGTFTETGLYPAWQFRRNSPLREAMSKVFLEMYGYEPKVQTIHAGVECGVLSAKIEGLDAVSIGPELYDIHTPSERMSISSMNRVFDFVVKVLENC